jgi:hypothetical protein
MTTAIIVLAERGLTIALKSDTLSATLVVAAAPPASVTLLRPVELAGLSLPGDT